MIRYCHTQSHTERTPAAHNLCSKRPSRTVTCNVALLVFFPTQGNCVKCIEVFVDWSTHTPITVCPETVFLNRRAAARYRVLASIIPGRERFAWNLSFWFSKQFSWINVLQWKYSEEKKYSWMCRKTQTQMLAWGNYNMLQDFISPVIDK